MVVWGGKKNQTDDKQEMCQRLREMLKICAENGGTGKHTARYIRWQIDCEVVDVYVCRRHRWSPQQSLLRQIRTLNLNP